MSKFRPMDSNCSKCNGGRLSATCWTKGEYKIVDGKRKLIHRGYWNVRCDSCNYKFKIS